MGTNKYLDAIVYYQTQLHINLVQQQPEILMLCWFCSGYKVPLSVLETEWFLRVHLAPSTVMKIKSADKMP
jgi:hypothetical protein